MWRLTYSKEAVLPTQLSLYFMLRVQLWLSGGTQTWESERPGGIPLLLPTRGVALNKLLKHLWAPFPYSTHGPSYPAGRCIVRITLIKVGEHGSYFCCLLFPLTATTGTHVHTCVHTQEHTQSILSGPVEAVWDLVLESRKWPWWKTGQDDQVG